MPYTGKVNELGKLGPIASLNEDREPRTITDTNTNHLVIGFPFVSEMMTSDLTAPLNQLERSIEPQQVNNVVLELWCSAYGEIGELDYGYNNAIISWSSLVSSEAHAHDARFEDATVHNDWDVDMVSGMIGPKVINGGWGKLVVISLRQTQPYPFNIVAIHPQL